VKTVLCCGLGVDSTALLILCKQISLVPDLILFADTGGEKPETYHFKEILEKWLDDNGFPKLVTVKAQYKAKGKVVTTLEEQLLEWARLPGIAYGIKQCSVEWKKNPCDKYCKSTYPEEEFTYLISYNADELKRMEGKQEKVGIFTYKYPLIEAGWGRLRCLEEIAKSDLPFPTKSSCFFCPSSKKKDIKLLNEKYPKLMQRALTLEEKANDGGTVVGLGRRFKWSDLIEQENNQYKLDLDFESNISACGCIEAGVNIDNYWNQFE